MPKQNSTGGKERLGSISKAGNRYLRSLLVVGALSVIRRAKQVGYTRRPWLAELMMRRPVKVAAIALANKIARTGVWFSEGPRPPRRQIIRSARIGVDYAGAVWSSKPYRFKLDHN